MRFRVVLALLAAVVLTGAGEQSGGSLETVSGSARLVERGGGLTLLTGIRARCRAGTCGYDVTVTRAGRRLGARRGEVAAGAPRDLRVRVLRALPSGRRIRIRIDATLSPPAGEEIGLARSTYVRVPRQG